MYFSIKTSTSQPPRHSNVYLKVICHLSVSAVVSFLITCFKVNSHEKSESVSVCGSGFPKNENQTFSTVHRPLRVGHLLIPKP